MKGQNFFSGRRELQNRTSPLAYELKCSCARKTRRLPCSFFLLFVCLPTRHDSENSFKCFHAFQIELKFESVGFSGEDKTWVPGENPFGARMRTNNKLNPQMASTPGNKPAPHWWEASALITGPSLLHPPPPPLSWLSCLARSGTLATQAMSSQCERQRARRNPVHHCEIKV